MPCRLALMLAALALAFAPTLPARAASDDSNWSDQDTINEKRGIRLLDNDQPEAAEVLFRQILEHNPNSSPALMLHAHALRDLGRFPEALVENRKAVNLDPDNPIDTDSLGITLLRAKQPTEAIGVFQKALALDSGYEDASVGLAEAYMQTGQRDRADSILNALLSPSDGSNPGDTAESIANIFHQTGDDAAAVTWWQRAYKLGDTDAARFLAWAYDSGIGVPCDAGASTYWARRGPDAPFAWFPRRAHADQIVNWAHGWGVVLILLATAIILPWITISLVAFFPARSLVNDPAFPWMDRARRAYPFMILLSYSVLLVPLLDLVSITYYPPFVLPISKWILIWIVFGAGFWSCNVVVVRWAWFYRRDAGTAAQNMKDIGITLLIYLPTFVAFGIMGIYLPDHLDWQAAWMIAATILIYLFIQFGGWIRLARLSRLITPADPELIADAAELAHQRQLPAPTVWIIPWRKANALAFIFSNAIVVTKKSRTILTRDEMKSVLAHELAHLCEDRVTLAMRLAVPLLLLPMFTMNLWSSSEILIGLGVSYVLFLTGAFILRRRARRMEERADSFGKAAESEAGIYPLALAKLYESNLIPAVMPGKRKVHPHLYDRLLAAGITPDYPRPKPPGRWGTIAGFLVLVLNAIALAAIWLSLF